MAMSIFAELGAGVTTSLPEEMEALGARLAAALPDNCLLALHGDLGAGKTTFVKGLARGLGIRSTVTSPTFNIYTVYTGQRQLIHIDAYRLQSADEIESLCIEEFLRPPFILAVEWPGHIPAFMEDLPRFELRLSIDAQHRHLIVLHPAENLPSEPL